MFPDSDKLEKELYEPIGRVMMSLYMTNPSKEQALKKFQETVSSFIEKNPELEGQKVDVYNLAIGAMYNFNYGFRSGLVLSERPITTRLVAQNLIESELLKIFKYVEDGLSSQARV